MTRTDSLDWARFLADAGARLTASLEIQTTLEAVTALAVPRLADWAAIHLRERDGIRTVAVSHAQHREDLVWDMLRRYPATFRSRYGFPNVIKTGRPELLRDVTDAVLDAVSVDDENLRLLKALDLRTEICVPLSARGDVFGALTLATSGASGRRYDDTDLERALELAERCATAIDNAQLYHAAQEAIAVRDEFLAVAAHELRTPLAALLLAAHSLDKTAQAQADEHLIARVARVNRQLIAMNELVERLLDVSAMEGGEFRVQPGDMDLARLVGDVVERFRPGARRVGSTIDVHAPESLTGRWDSQRLDQVLTNLLANAIRFSAGRSIGVDLTGDEEEVTLVVTDRGPGISADRLPYIFDRWERGTSARNYAGLGLGLYVTRRIVQAHGGDITVASEPGKGACFTVRLPRRAPVPEAGTQGFPR